MHGKEMKTKRGGFTLIEIMIAVIILVIGILSVSQMTVLGMQTSTAINLKMYARATLDNMFENLNNLPITNALLNDPDGIGDLDDTLTADHQQFINNQSSGYHTYRVLWNVANGDPNISFRTMRIWVLWRGGSINATAIRRNAP